MAKGIFKRSNSKYYWIRYAGLDGRIIRESSGSTKFSDAQVKLNQRRTEIDRGQQPETKRIGNHTFNELAERYLTWMNGRHRSASSKAYRIKDMRARFGSLPLRRFNALVVEKYQTDLIGRGLKHESADKNLSILKAMFKKAVEWEMVEEETLKRVRKVKLFNKNNRRLRYLSKEQCRELLEVCSTTLRPIVTMALNTGMRRGEILGLTWDRVDLRHGFILLNVTKNGERREIPINGTLRATLQGLMRRIDVPYVFFDPKTGKPFRDLKRSFIMALRRSKIMDFRFHDLRHTFASHLVMSKVDLTTVKELLGHKSLNMTLRYAHLAPAHKVKALDVLDGNLNGSTAHLVHSGHEIRVTANV